MNAEMQRTLKNLNALQNVQQKIQAADRYLKGVEAAQKVAFASRSKNHATNLKGLGWPEVGGYDLLDADTYVAAWDGTTDAVGGGWDWLTDQLEWVGENVIDVYDRLAEVTTGIKDGFTSMLDIAYVTADGVAELWALYKWVGGPSDYINLQRTRDNWLVKRRKNSRKYGPFYMRAELDGSKPIDMPDDSTHARFISKAQADAMSSNNPDYKGTRNMVGMTHETWTYYLPGKDGIIPDWRNPLDYPNAVLYWYYDAQIEKIDDISKNFSLSKMGQVRDWLFERGTLVQAWMSGGWQELYNLKQLVDQNYKIARARTELIGHDAAATTVAGVQTLLSTADPTDTEGEDISVLGIKSAKQVAQDKAEFIRRMFPYNAKAFMGPQMWMYMNDYRQSMKDKKSVPYPLINMEGKVDATNLNALDRYLKNLKTEKIAAAQLLDDSLSDVAAKEIQDANEAYENIASDITNMPMIFVEGMMSAFGGRAGPFYSLDADKQFGDFPWINADAFALANKPDSPSSLLVSLNNSDEVINGWLTGSMGNAITQRFDWLGAQPDWNMRGWGYGTQIYSTKNYAKRTGSDISFNLERYNLGEFFDWHPFLGLWCHDGETHLAGQFATHNNATKQPMTQDYWNIDAADLVGAYVSDNWNWVESLVFEPTMIRKTDLFTSGNPNNALYIGGGAASETNRVAQATSAMVRFNFMMRKNEKIVPMNDTGDGLVDFITGVPNTSLKGATATSNGAALANGITSQFTGTTPDPRNFAAGVFGSVGLQGEGWFSRETLGMYNLNHSPVQSIFAVGTDGNKVKSIWSATEGKRFTGGPAIGHGRKIRTQRTNYSSEMPGFRYVAGFTNYHAITQPVYHPVAATLTSNMSGFTGGWGSKKLAPSIVYGVVGMGQYEMSSRVDALIDNVFDLSQKSDYRSEGYWTASSGMNDFIHGSTGNGLSNTEIRDHISTNWLGLYGQTATGFSHWIGGSDSPFDRAGVGFLATPPTDVIGTTGLSPRPGVYSKLPSGRAPGIGNITHEFNLPRFPGAHKYGAAATATSRNKLDYSEPYRTSFWNKDKIIAKTQMKSLMMPMLKNSRVGAAEDGFHAVASNYTLLTTYPGYEVKADYRTQSQSNRDGLWFENVKWEGIGSDTNIYAPDLIGSYLGRNVEPFTAQANFNYAMLENGYRTSTFIARKLLAHWKIYPDTHNNLAFIIDKAINKQTISSTWSWSGSGGFSGKHGIGNTPRVINPAPTGKIDNAVKQSWTLNDIKNALSYKVFNGDNRMLWQTMMLAEPDNNPIGVWYDTQDPSHEFFGITDLNKLRESGDLNYTTSDGQMKRIGIIKDKGLWDMHRALSAKDTNQISESTLDWFGSKVTKYGWCHIMQGTTPVRLDKMKAPVALPRYWAPLFVPFRSINEFAPRLYFGVDENVQQVGQASGDAINNHASFWLDSNVNKVLPDNWHGPYTATTISNFEQSFGALPATPSTPYQEIWLSNSGQQAFYLKKISNTEYKIGILKNNQDTDETQNYWSRDAKTDLYIERPNNEMPSIIGPPSITSPSSWLEGISAALRLQNDNSMSSVAVGYSRESVIGINPHYDDFDDNRLFGGVTLKPGESKTSTRPNAKLSHSGSHWASQFSWVNSGWYGFDSIEEAELFIANQFKGHPVEYEGAQYNWKGMITGPPTGTIGFGPIDDLIDFVRYYDTLIMEKVDLERIYKGTLERYKDAKRRLESIASFDLEIINASIDDIMSGAARVIPKAGAQPKTYRWMPVFAYLNELNDEVFIHPDNADIVFEYLDRNPNTRLQNIDDISLYPAATNSPDKFVAAVIIERQPQNSLDPDASWVFDKTVMVQGRQDGFNDNLESALQQELKTGQDTKPNVSNEALVPFAVNGQIGKTAPIITGGLFKQWEELLTSDKSPFGRFLNKIRFFENGAKSLWANKMPGFNISMQEFWGGLSEDNNVISEFLSDLTTLISNAKQDYGAVSSSVVNINDKVETYLDRFEQMSVNWSNSIQAMNTYADYMAKAMFSLNEKAEAALSAFVTPYSSFVQTISSEESPMTFNKAIQVLEKAFEKNDKLSKEFGKKLEFSGFKDKGSECRMALRGIMSAINGSGLAEINRASNLGQTASPIVGKPWLEIAPPPFINLDFKVPPIREWVDEPVNEVITPNWGETEFNETDLPSRVEPQEIRPIVDPALRRPPVRKLGPVYSAYNPYDRVVAGRGVGPARPGMTWSPGDRPYATFPQGVPRTQIGYGPNGAYTTYYMDTPPTPDEFDLKVGDRWFDYYSQNLFVWDGVEWLLGDASLQIKPIASDGSELVVDPRGQYMDDLTSQFTNPVVEIPRVGDGQGQDSAPPTPIDTAPGGGSSANTGGGGVATPGGGPALRVSPMSSLNGPLRYRRNP